MDTQLALSHCINNIMAVSSMFPGMYTAPLSVAVASRDATRYLMRGTYVMGIRSLPKSYSFPYLMWSLAIIFMATVYQPIGFLTSYIIHMSEFTPAAFLSSAQVAFNVWSCSAKVIIIWLRLHYLDKANDVLDVLDKRCVKTVEKQTIRQTVALSNRIFFMYMVIYLGYSLCTFLNSGISGQPPYQNYYPYIDWRANNLQFWLQSSLEYFAMGGASFQNACADCYPINYILILRMHIQILTERVYNLGTDSKLSNDENYEELVKCILDHKTILKFCDNIRPVISGTIFTQFLVMSIVLGLTLINIMVFADFYTAVGSVIYLSAVVLETTPLCILCNYVMSDCDKLADGIFGSNWIDKEQRYKKTLLHFLYNAQQPIVFSAMNVFPITVATNISLTKFGFSVYTLVQQMNIAERFKNT